MDSFPLRGNFELVEFVYVHLHAGDRGMATLIDRCP